MGEKQQPVTTRDHWDELAKKEPGQKIMVNGVTHIVCMTGHDDRKYAVPFSVPQQLAA